LPTIKGAAAALNLLGKLNARLIKRLRNFEARRRFGKAEAEQ